MKNVILALVLITATVANAQTDQQPVKAVTSENQIVKERSKEKPQFGTTEELAKALDIDLATAERVLITYNEYKDSRKALMQPMREQRKEMHARSEKMTDADYERAYRTNLDIQRKRLSMDESYYNRFLEIMPASKVHILLKQNKNLNRKPYQKRTRTQGSK